ncbi:MAG: hypothetical protein ACJZ02_02010 [Candidatus Neomarinimicrobiota bacterium]
MAEEQSNEVDAQKVFLMAKINELTDGVAPGYGEEFLEELMRRLEKTVFDFNDEVTLLLDMLKSQSIERNEKLNDLIEKGDQVIIESVKSEKSSAETEMSDWEKRLESQSDSSEKKNESESKSVKEKSPVKKSIFSWKKKKKD